MINRPRYLEALEPALGDNPVTAPLGPRQCGKTTLAQFLSRQTAARYFGLEDPRDLARLESSMLALERLDALVIIDEVQRKPELFEILRVLVDRCVSVWC